MTACKAGVKSVVSGVIGCIGTHSKMTLKEKRLMSAAASVGGSVASAMCEPGKLCKNLECSVAAAVVKAAKSCTVSAGGGANGYGGFECGVGRVAAGLIVGVLDTLGCGDFAGDI